MDKLKIVQGSTLEQPVRWGIEPIRYIPIEAVLQLTPLQLQCTAHDLYDMWRFEFISLVGLTGLNSTGKGKDTDYHYATVVDPDTIEVNDVAGTEYDQYVSGGFLKCYSPMDLTGHEAVLTVWDKVGGTELLVLTSAGGDIAIDPTQCRITINMSAVDTAALLWKKGVFGLDMIHTASGKSTKIASGPAIVEIE